jgi:transposase
MVETPETTLQATQTQTQTMDPGMEPGQLQPHRDCSTCSVWAQNQRLETENQKLRTENQALRHRLEHYENIHTRNQPHRPRRKRKRTIVRYPGRPQGHTGTTRPKPPKPDTVIQTQTVEKCPQCGEGLGQPVYTKKRILEEIPDTEPVKIMGYEEHHYLCPGCDSSIVARHPDCPPRGRFGKNVYVQTTLLKFEDRLPLDKIGSVLGRQGLETSNATIHHLLWRTANWLRPNYDQVLAQVRSSPVVYTDQTGIKVDGEQHWIWVLATRTEILYAIRDTKGKRILEELLGKNWPGYLVCDGLRSHHAYTNNIQRCWSHLLTEADQLVELAQENQKTGDPELEALAQGLHRIYDRTTRTLHRIQGQENQESLWNPGNLPGSLSMEKKLERNAKQAMKYWLGKDYHRPRTKKFVEKIRRGYPYWFTFINHPGMEPTNNKSERSLRELVVHRKIIGTLRNGKGTLIYETLPTLLATWKQRGLDPPTTLSTTLTNNWQNHTTQNS